MSMPLCMRIGFNEVGSPITAARPKCLPESARARAPDIELSSSAVASTTKGRSVREIHAFHCSRDHSKEAFHITTAQTVKPVIRLSHRKRFKLPARLIVWDRIGVPGQYQSTGSLAKDRNQVMLTFDFVHWLNFTSEPQPLNNSAK